MDLSKDFRDLCALLNAKGIEYLIVGGYAVAFHGAPRFTGDLDLLIRPDESSVNRMLAVVQEFGFPIAGVNSTDLLERQTILQLGRVPRQIHLMTAVSGLTWEVAWNSRQEGKYGDVRVLYLGREALLTNKRACGRAKDLADVEALTKQEIS
ncbi:MAG: hypothetical protein HY822_19530 [Acidobacteria bacterium]|nr:hypothetical protein [Acidobacteriota bacterium]